MVQYISYKMIFNSGIRTIFSWYKISEDMNLKTAKLICQQINTKIKLQNSAKYLVKKIQSLKLISESLIYTRSKFFGQSIKR